MTLHDERDTTLPDVFDIVRGEVVPLMPTGGQRAIVEGRVHRVLSHLEDRGLGLPLVGEVGVVVEQDPLTCRGADAVFLLQRQLPFRQSREGFLLTAPALVVEVVSPIDRAGELEKKVQEYLGAGVQVVWVVYPDARIVRVHLHDGTERRLKPEDTLWAGSILPFDVPVSFLFEGLEAAVPRFSPPPSIDRQVLAYPRGRKPSAACRRRPKGALESGPPTVPVTDRRIIYRGTPSAGWLSELRQARVPARDLKARIEGPAREPTWPALPPSPWRSG